MLKFIIPLILATVAFGAEGDKPLVPSELLPVLSVYEREVGVAYKAFQEATAKAAEKADLAMDSVKKKYISQGSDADGLLLVVQQQKDLRANVTLDKVLENIKKNAVENLLGGRNDPKKDIVGEWIINRNDGTYNATWTFNPDFTVNSTSGVPVGKWEIKQNVIRISWRDRGAWEELNMPIINNTTTVNSWVGGKNVATIKKKIK